MTEDSDPSELRASLRQSWECAAAGWGQRAETMREMGMPVSSWMIERLGLVPGQRVLELAAGPGDTGFLAAPLVAVPGEAPVAPPGEPGGAARPGTVICSDGAEAMLEVARARAQELGIENVEFRRLELEWIDLPAAAVDAILCRWGVMLVLDPETCLRECRRVLAPGGRISLAVWDEAAENPWATIPGSALVELGHAQAPAAGGPGMFALAAGRRLKELLGATGFTGVEVDRVPVARRFADADLYVEQTLDLSPSFSDAWSRLSEAAREEVRGRLRELARPFTGADGALHVPGRALVACANA